MNAYLMSSSHGLYLVFGEDALSAGEVLARLLSCDVDDFSVGGSWVIDPEKPLNVGSWWPYFTAYSPSSVISKDLPERVCDAKSDVKGS